MKLKDVFSNLLATFINRIKKNHNNIKPNSEVRETMVIHKPKNEHELSSELNDGNKITNEAPQTLEHENNQIKILTLQTNIDLPQFVKQQPYKSDNPTTIKIRTMIKDEFGGGRNGWDLQCTEYTHFKVNQKINIYIIWPKNRTLPRHGRNWAKIFENSYKISEIPKANCAMSFTNPSFNHPYGHVAFVEEVLSDYSVKISEANWPGEGKYNERTIPSSDWQNKYQAKFIDFTKKII